MPLENFKVYLFLSLLSIWKRHWIRVNSWKVHKSTTICNLSAANVIRVEINKLIDYETCLWRILIVWRQPACVERI